MKNNNLKKLCAIIVVVVIALSAISFVACNEKGDDNTGQTITKGNDDTPKTFIKADGIRLLDLNGEPMGLQGTNLGGWLVQEEWLCPSTMLVCNCGSDHTFENCPSKQVKAYAQVDILLTLYNRFGEDEAIRLLDVYEDNWVTEKDFENIKALGMNSVRIPFTYLNFMDALKFDETKNEWVKKDWAELTIKQENNDGFERLDWALSMCEKYGLFAILDMHGAVGSQSGQDHTGDISEYLGRLYLQDDVGATCRQKTKELWVAIAERYKDNPYVAAYDILNEPGLATSSGSGKNQSTSEEVVTDYFDELYDAIRAVDGNHIISFESCWEAGHLPDPDEYGWDNVLYQYHHYNWASANMANKLFYWFKVNSIDGDMLDRDFPVIIGEFNVWADTHPDKTTTAKDNTQTEEQAWAGTMELYTGKGWSYTTWNFKHCATHSSWGLFNLNEGTDEPQADLLHSTAAEIEYAWSFHNASNYHENTALTNCIKPYINDFYTGETTKSTTEEYYILGD